MTRTDPADARRSFHLALSACVTHHDVLYAVLDAVGNGVLIRDLRQDVNDWERLCAAEVQYARTS